MHEASADQAIDNDEYEKMFQIDREAVASGTGVIDDPYPTFAQILERGPVHAGTLQECMGLSPDEVAGLYRPGFQYFSVFSFAAVSQVFTRAKDFCSDFYNDIGIPRSLGDTLLNMDGIRHRKYRNLLQDHFQPATANSWWREKVISGLVDELVERLEGQDSVDLNSQFYARLPMHTVTAAFGMSPADGIAFRRFIQVAMDHDTPPEVAGQSVKSADAILEAVIAQRQAEPQDDVISMLAHSTIDLEGEEPRLLNVEEIKNFCRLIVFAGGGTTWRQLGITTFALLNNRDQLEAVMADRSLIEPALLESVRWNPTDPLFPRKAMHDTELEGVHIPAGSVMHLCLGAANRDPTRWENPEKYDLFRPVQRSLAFAAGAHSCMGQHVARQEMTVAFNALFDRFPNMRWDPSKPAAKLSGGLLARGPGPLHVLLN